VVASLVNDFIVVGEEESSPRAAPVRLPQCSMEEAGYSSTRGSRTRVQGPSWRTLAMPAMGGRVFPRREGRCGPRALR
jgi:hypothetical protein